MYLKLIFLSDSILALLVYSESILAVYANLHNKPGLQL